MTAQEACICPNSVCVADLNLCSSPSRCLPSYILMRRVLLSLSIYARIFQFYQFLPLRVALRRQNYCETRTTLFQSYMIRLLLVQQMPFYRYCSYRCRVWIVCQQLAALRLNWDYHWWVSWAQVSRPRRSRDQFQAVSQRSFWSYSLIPPFSLQIYNENCFSYSQYLPSFLVESPPRSFILLCNSQFSLCVICQLFSICVICCL